MTGKHQTASLIADTAMELFRKKGYESVSVNSICEQAGVSRVTFYSIFSNKDQIIGFILNDFQNQFKEDFSSFIAAENDFERVMILFNYYVELSERGGYQLMLELLKAELERSIGIMDAVYVFNDWFVKLIGNCQKSGIIRNKGNAAELVSLGIQVAISAQYEWCRRKGCSSGAPRRPDCAGPPCRNCGHPHHLHTPSLHLRRTTGRSGLQGCSCRSRCRR